MSTELAGSALMTKDKQPYSRDQKGSNYSVQSSAENTKGFFLSLEGIDFTWKSPISFRLADEYQGRGIKSLLLTRDPPYWLSPWDSFRYFFEMGESLYPLAEAHLLLTARLDNYGRVIQPALISGKLVIADRYVDSWFAYQSIRIKDHFGGDILAALNYLIDQHMILQENKLLSLPDLTVLIDDNPKVALERARPDELKSKYDVLDIQELVRENYSILAQRFSQRIVTVKIAGRSIEEVFADVLSHVDERLQPAYHNIDNSNKIYREGEQGRHIMAKLSDFPIGSRIQATRTIAWTLGEFDDYPFIAQKGSLGTVVGHHPKWGLQVVWDDDPYKSFPKRLQVEGMDEPPVMLVRDD
jgi:dTMP kinase